MIIALAIATGFLAGALVLWCVLWVASLNERSKDRHGIDITTVNYVGLWRFLRGGGE